MALPLTNPKIQDDFDRGNLSEWDALKKCLVVTGSTMSIIIAMTVLTLMAFELVKLAKENNAKFKPDRSVCTNSDCQEASDKIQKFLKPDEDPCKDFYRFACGALLDKNMKAALETLASVDRIDRRLMTLLTTKPKKGPKYYEFPYRLYEACTKSEPKEISDVRLYVKILSRLEMPILEGDDWDEADWDWESAIIMTREYGYAFNYIFAVQIRFIESQTLGVFIDEPAVDAIEKVNYYKLLSFYLSTFGNIAKVEQATLRESLEKVLSFKKSLKKIMASTKANNETEIFTINELQTKFDYINWLDYFNGLLPKGMTFNGTEKIRTFCVEFFEKLRPLLQDTPKREIANYIGCRVLEDSVEYLPHNYYSVVMNLLGKTPTAIDAKCKNDVVRSLQNLLIQFYITTYPVADTKALSSQIASNVVTSFSRMLENTNWLDSRTLNKVISKLNNLQFLTGYLKDSVNGTLLESLYGDIDFEYANYLDMHLRLSKAFTDFLFRSLRTSVDPTLMLMMVGADIFQKNGVYVQCAVMQSSAIFLGHLEGSPTTFYPNAPKYVNYGNTGWAIAHEVTHSLDSENIKFDADGVFGNILSEDADKIFKERQECLKRQYDGFIDAVTNTLINGTKTLQENMADNAGLLAAYEAYVTWLTYNEREPSLPGLEKFNETQMFWISAAQSQCERLSDEMKKNEINKHPHPFGEFRVLGAFQNSQNFSYDFGCKPGEPMNPFDKCSLFGPDQNASTNIFGGQERKK